MRSPSRPPGLRLPSCGLGFTLGQMLFLAIRHFLGQNWAEESRVTFYYTLFTHRKTLSTESSGHIFPLLLPLGQVAWKNQAIPLLCSCSEGMIQVNDLEKIDFFFCLRILVWFSFPSWHTILLSDLLEEYWYSELGIGQPNNWFKKGEKRKIKITVLSLFLEGSNQRQKRKQGGSGITSFPLRQRESLIDY